MSAFTDRAQAGELLAEKLSDLRLDQPVVVALPRGGVPIGCACALKLNAPLDLCFVRKIAVPGYPEVAAAAIVDGEHPIIIENMQQGRQSAEAAKRFAGAQSVALSEIRRQRDAYERFLASGPKSARTVVIVDDGAATGTTLRAAIAAMRKQGAARVIVAIPVAPQPVVTALQREADHVVCLIEPRHFIAVSGYYGDFHQVTDREVEQCLAAASQHAPSA